MYKRNTEARSCKHCCSGKTISVTYSERVFLALGTAVAQWLRCCATNQKVAGSIPDGVIGIFR